MPSKIGKVTYDYKKKGAAKKKNKQLKQGTLPMMKELYNSKRKGKDKLSEEVFQSIEQNLMNIGGAPEIQPTPPSQEGSKHVGIPPSCYQELIKPQLPIDQDIINDGNEGGSVEREDTNLDKFYISKKEDSAPQIVETDQNQFTFQP